MAVGAVGKTDWSDILQRCARGERLPIGNKSRILQTYRELHTLASHMKS